MPYSYLTASIGLIFAAFHAGYELDSIPTRRETPMASPTDVRVITGVRDIPLGPPPIDPGDVL